MELHRQSDTRLRLVGDGDIILVEHVLASAQLHQIAIEEEAAHIVVARYFLGLPEDGQRLQNSALTSGVDAGHEGVAGQWDVGHRESLEVGDDDSAKHRGLLSISYQFP